MLAVIGLRDYTADASPMSSIPAQLKQHALERWKTRFPTVNSLLDSLDDGLPKSATVFLGRTSANNRFLFINFQRHPKSWYSFLFTVNVVVSESFGPPTPWLPDDPGKISVGVHRLGDFVNGMDRWWALEDRRVRAGDRKDLCVQQLDHYGDSRQTINRLIDQIGAEIEEHVIHPGCLEDTPDNNTLDRSR